MILRVQEFKEIRTGYLGSVNDEGEGTHVAFQYTRKNNASNTRRLNSRKLRKEDKVSTIKETTRESAQPSSGASCKRRKLVELWSSLVTGKAVPNLREHAKGSKTGDEGDLVEWPQAQDWTKTKRDNAPPGTSTRAYEAEEGSQ